MEPISMALGVVSLGMQLVGTAAAIRDQINAYKSASKELSALSDKLDDIEVVCYSLEAAFKCCEQAPKPWDVVLLKKLHKIMSHCRDRISRLHEVISKITSSQSTGLLAFNTVGARFLQHKSTIRKCNDDLDHSLASLHLHMTTNILVMNLRPPAQSSDSLALAVVTPGEAESRNSNRLSTGVVKRRRKRSQTDIQTQKWHWSCLSLYSLERTKVRRVKRHAGNPSPSTVQEESSFLVGSPLLGLYARLSVQRGSLSPLRISLRFPHIFTFAEDSWFLADVAGMVAQNDVGEFQKLLNKYSLTPATSLCLLGSTSNETDTFLGMAVTANAHRIQDFLIDQCPGLPQERNHLPLNYDMLYGLGSRRFDYDLGSVRAYIDARGDALTPPEFLALLSGAPSATEVSSCVEACKYYHSEEWETFNWCLWTTIFQVCLNLGRHVYAGPKTYDQERDRWVSLMRQTISDGVDIHSHVVGFSFSAEDVCMDEQDLSTVDRMSALQTLLYSCGDLEEFQHSTHHWVEMLQQAGADVDQYLEREISEIESMWEEFAGWPDETSFPREFRVEEYKGWKLPSWTTTVTTSAAPELFAEFPHFSTWDSFGNILIRDGGPEPHRAWKNPIRVGGEVVKAPLERWSLNWHRLPRPLTERDRRVVEGLAYACDLMESRFERKHMKKLHKAGYLKEFSALKFKERIPGTWVD